MIGAEPAEERGRDAQSGMVDRRDEADQMTLGPPVGFVGLGAMGLPMAVRLVNGGHAVLACDADPVRLALLVDACGQVPRLHTTPVPAELADRCEVIILMLPTSRHVAEVVDALRPTLRPGTLVIDMGSSVPGETRKLAADLAPLGVALIDAPVSGSVAGAEAGTLAIMAGGGDAEIARADPFFAAMGRTVIRTGAVGSGHAVKALNNFCYAAGLLAACEALRMGEVAGLDLGVLTDVINASSGRNFATETKLRQHILNGAYAGGFKLGLMAKDLETAGALAAETGVDAATLEACRVAWRRAVEVLGPDADNTEIHKFAGSG